MNKIDFISYFDEVFSRLLVALKDDLHFLDGGWLYCRPEGRPTFFGWRMADGGWWYCRPEGRSAFLDGGCWYCRPEGRSAFKRRVL